MIVWLLALIIWPWAYALHWLFPTEPTQFFWLNATYFGVVAVPAAFFVFTLQLTHNDSWLSKHNLWLFLIEPILTLLLLWTDPWHGLFFGGKRLYGTSDIFEGGPWFWTNVVYSYSLILLGFIVLIRSYLRATGKIYRRQLGAAILGATLPLAGNIASLSGHKVLPGLDLTPVLFIFSSIFYSYSILRFRLFDLTPVAHGAILEDMQDGILVLDTQNRVVEVNSAALKFLGTNKTEIIGEEASNYLPRWDELDLLLQEFSDERVRIQQSFGNQSIYDVQITTLKSRTGKYQGHLLTWRDISALKKAEKDLRFANEQLRSQLSTIEVLQESLREQAIRDPLTNLFNRRYLEEILPQEIARANRRNYPLSFLLIDVDHFKGINDQYGHAFGDAVLRELARLLVASTRQGDVVVRYGGEEFLIILIDAPLSIAHKRADDLRRRVETKLFLHDGRVASITISVGIADFPAAGIKATEVLGLADQALYHAKSLGRNTVVSC